MTLNKSNLVVRAMKQSDLELAYEIECECYDDPWSINNFNSCLDGLGVNFVILIDDQLIGYAMLVNVMDESQLMNIAIAKSEQGNGYGHYLLEAVIRNIGEGIKDMWLEVRKSNTVAQKLYEKLGFSKIGIRKNYYPSSNTREDAIIFKCTLNNN